MHTCRICTLPRRCHPGGVWVCRVCDLAGLYAWWHRFVPPVW